MKKLIGKTVKSIYIDRESQEYLKFRTDTGDFVYKTDGDCCSETWFADIIGIASLLNEKIINVEEIEMPECTDNRTRQEEDVIYCYKIQTCKGHTDIIFRNSSNGYYGGEIGLCKRQHIIDKVKFKKITDDYTA